MYVSKELAPILKEKGFDVPEKWGRCFVNSGGQIEDVTFSSKEACDTAYRSDYYLVKIS